METGLQARELVLCGGNKDLDAGGPEGDKAFLVGLEGFVLGNAGAWPQGPLGHYSLGEP